MENEKFQELVLEQLSILTKSVDTLALNQELMQEDIQHLKEDVAVLKEDMKVLKQDVEILKEDVDFLKKDMENFRDELGKTRQSQARIEYNLSEKITALFDFRDSQLQTNKDFAARLERLEAK